MEGTEKMSCQYCGGENCGSSAGGPGMCEDPSEDFNYSRYAVRDPARVSSLVREPVAVDVEALWRTRVETTLYFYWELRRNMMAEEDAARRENQKAYFAGAARAWELAAQELEKLLRL